MSPLNLDFSIALSKISTKCVEALRDSLKQGRKAGRIRSGINEQDAAYFILAGYWGVRNIGKIQNSQQCYTNYLDELKRYLKSLE